MNDIYWLMVMIWKIIMKCHFIQTLKTVSTLLQESINIVPGQRTKLIKSDFNLNFLIEFFVAALCCHILFSVRLCRVRGVVSQLYCFQFPTPLVVALQHDYRMLIDRWKEKVYGTTKQLQLLYLLQMNKTIKTF